jgi:predicted secreted acid phosphatase
MEAYVREAFGVEAPRWSLYKGARRATIAGKYRILLLLGDSQGDFYSLEPPSDASPEELERLLLAHLTPAERERIDEQYGWYFEDRWIPLPNAVYGNWESSFIQYRSMPVAERAQTESAMLSTE